eukprot:357798-Chlamydomonas_euryale.AAC.14
MGSFLLPLCRCKGTTTRESSRRDLRAAGGGAGASTWLRVVTLGVRRGFRTGTHGRPLPGFRSDRYEKSLGRSHKHSGAGATGGDATARSWQAAAATPNQQMQRTSLPRNAFLQEGPAGLGRSCNCNKRCSGSRKQSRSGQQKARMACAVHRSRVLGTDMHAWPISHTRRGGPWQSCHVAWHHISRHHMARHHMAQHHTHMSFLLQAHFLPQLFDAVQHIACMVLINY